VELKHDVRDIKSTLDAQFYEDHVKWENRVLDTVDDDKEMIRVLLSVDCTKSAKQIETEVGLKQVKCWRILNRLERKGIIFKLEDTKQGSVVYCKSRWYKLLRLDEVVQKRLSSNRDSDSSAQQQHVDQQPTA
jgi:predicted transcriptional regulator